MTTPLDIARRAQEIFHRNSETLIAGFLIRNPDICPEDVELVFQQVGGSLRFSIEPKELYVPPEDNYMPDIGADQGDLDVAHRMSYSEGWNDCRQEMIDFLDAKLAAADDRHTLKEFTDEL